MQYDLCSVWDEQRGETRLVIFGPEDGEGVQHARLARVDAEDWLHAKQALGFELTAFQERLLPLDEVGRAAAVFSERWAGMGDLLVRQPHVAYPKGWISQPVHAAHHSEGRQPSEAARRWNARRGL